MLHEIFGSGTKTKKCLNFAKKNNCIGWTITLEKLRLQFCLISAYKSHIHKNLFDTIKRIKTFESKELKLVTNFKKICHQSVM